MQLVQGPANTVLVLDATRHKHCVPAICGLLLHMSDVIGSTAYYARRCVPMDVFPLSGTLVSMPRHFYEIDHVHMYVIHDKCQLSQREAFCHGLKSSVNRFRPGLPSDPAGVPLP